MGTVAWQPAPDPPTASLQPSLPHSSAHRFHNCATISSALIGAVFALHGSAASHTSDAL